MEGVVEEGELKRTTLQPSRVPDIHSSVHGLCRLLRHRPSQFFKP